MTSVAEIISDIESLDEADLRRTIFSGANDAPDPGQPYPHQIEALRRIELGADRTPPVSGILHYPTGVGKTRVGMELIARALRANPRHRFAWATYTKTLIRQSMVRLVGLSKLFPPDTTFTWAESADELEDSENGTHVVFLTRNALTNAEIAVIVETLRRMFGRAATPQLEAAVKARSAPSTVPLERLDQTLTAAQQQLLLLQMAEVAAADGVVTAAERAMLDSVAARLRIPEAFVDAVLGGHLAPLIIGSDRDHGPALAAVPTATLPVQSVNLTPPSAPAPPS